MKDPKAIARELEHEHDPRVIVTKLGAAFAGEIERAQVGELCAIREALAERSALVDTMFAMQGLGSYPITLAGGPKERVREIAAGKKIAAFAITEPDAGSDVAGMSTRATKTGDGFTLDGEKTFISNAGIADSYVVFAKTNDSVSAFLADARTPGLSAEPIELLAEHPIGTLRLAGCRAQLLGGEGQGLKLALGTLDVFRPTVGAAACGMARRALDEAIARVKSRRQFGKPLAEFQGLQFQLADMATELEAARLLVQQAAQNPGKRASAMAKLYATEAAQRIIDRALQLHGGAGLVAGSPTERLYRDIRALRIYEGTSEIQRIVIARDLLR
jgi:acyl-CoA dehydrogenase